MQVNRWRTFLKWTGIALAASIVGLAATLAFVDGNALRGPISRFASARLHRDVQMEHLQLHLWSAMPRARIGNLTIANPDWEQRRTMLQIQQADVELKLLYLLRGRIVLSLVAIDRPVLHLHRAKSGKANWEFGSATGTAPPSPQGRPAKLPLIQRFVVNDGRVTILDEVRKLKFEGTLRAHEGGTRETGKPFRLEGKGELNDRPFSLQLAGGALINLQPDQPYGFDADLRAGDIRLTARGKLPRPFNFGQLAADLEMSGDDLADLYYLTGLALPNTPRYRLAATVAREGRQFKITGIAGRVGSSDVRGTLLVDASGKRPHMQGDLASDLLDFADLAAPLGGEVAVQESAGPASANAESAAGAPAPGKTVKSKVSMPPDQPLLPDSSLQVNRVRAMDADVRFAAKAVNAGKLPLKRVAMHVKLKDGVLQVVPLTVDFPQGRLSGEVTLDARSDVPQTELDLRLADLKLEQFVGRKADAQPAFAGTMQARAQLHGAGDSVHDVASSADGSIALVVPRGEVRSALAELTGINVVNGVGLLLAKDQQKDDIRCGVADFDVQDGVMHAQNIVFDTEKVLITAQGEVRLGLEQLDLEIEGQPKRPRLGRLHSPIQIDGTLRQPSVGVDAGKVAGQAGVAVALGALVTPLAAIVAFIDPGLAKDADCAALLASGS